MKNSLIIGLLLWSYTSWSQCSTTTTLGIVGAGDTDITVSADKTVGDQNCTTSENRVYNTAGTTTVDGITLMNDGNLRVMQGKLNLTNFVLNNNGGCIKTIEVDDGAELEITTSTAGWKQLTIVNNGTLTINYTTTLAFENQNVVVHNNGTMNMYMDWFQVRDGCFFYNNGILNIGNESAFDTGNLEINNNGYKFCMSSHAAMNVKGYYKATNKEMIYYGGDATGTACIRIANTASHWKEVDGNLNDPGTAVFDDPNGNISMCAADGSWDVINGHPVSNGASPLLTSCTAAECIALPVALIAFEAYNIHSGVIVKWKTSEELNNDYFTLEKSTDGKNFTKVAIVPGEGNSFRLTEYEYHDHEVNDVLTYYRLSQTDYDGKTEVFDLVAVEAVYHPHYSFDMFPNPVDGTLQKKITIELRSELMKGSHLYVFDMMEQIVYSQESIEDIKFEIPVPEQKGIYYIVVYNGEGEEVQKFVVE